MLVRNCINFSKFQQQLMSKRFILMRKYAALRQELDEIKLSDENSKQQHQFNYKILTQSTKEQLKNNLSKDNFNESEHKSISNFKKLKNDVYNSFLNVKENQGTKWKRFPGLNEILKGHRPGELTIFTGPTGCGKTTFLSEYSLDLCEQGITTLWGNFELKNVVFLNKMLTQYARKSLEDNLDDFDELAQSFEKLPLHFLTFHGEESFKVVMQAMEHSVIKLGVKHILIDNIQFMIGNQMFNANSKFDRFQYQDSVIGECRKFATKYDCHITLVIHPRKEQFNEDLSNLSIFGGGKATQEADNIMILQMKWIDSNKYTKRLQISKNRFDGDLGSFALKFNKEHKGFGELSNEVEED